MIIVTTGNAQCLNTFDFPEADRFYVNKEDGCLYITDNTVGGVAIFYPGSWVFVEKRNQLRTTDET